MRMSLGTRLIASFLLIGEKGPIAPATWASLATLPIIYFYVGAGWWWQGGLLAVVTVIGTWASTVAEADYGHDGSPIVVDEVAGMLVTFVGIWPLSASHHWLFYLGGFLLFRFFDILKPFPVGRLQNLPGGYGVMADDLLAGVYSNLVLRLLLRVL